MKTLKTCSMGDLLGIRAVIFFVVALLAVIPCMIINFARDKEPIYIDVPSNLEDKFKSALSDSEISDRLYEIKLSENADNPSISIKSNKENDKTYKIFAYSPFVVAYSPDKKYNEELSKSKILVQSDYNKEFCDIDFSIVVEKVIINEIWKNSGVSIDKEIKVFYPAKNSEYWNDFWDFLLITTNKGKYPESKEKYSKAEISAKKFIDSQNAIPVSDFKEQLAHTGGYTDNAFWVFPEMCVLEEFFECQVYYPKITSNCYFYVKSDETGDKILSEFSFYKTFYRSSENTKIFSDDNEYKKYGFTDVYNCIDYAKYKNFD